MNEKALEQLALEFLAAEYERDGKAGSAEHIRTQPLLPNKARAVRAIAAALRQRPAPVDLEQFRSVISSWREDALIKSRKYVTSTTRTSMIKRVAEGDRLLSIIDNAGKACPCGEATCTESWEPGCGLGESVEHAVPVEREPPRGDELRAVLAQQPDPVVDAGNWIAADDRELNAGRLKALHRGLELARKWSAGAGTHGHTDRMVRDMADELRRALSSQDGDYDHQPATVVDDGGFDAWWKSHRIDPEFPDTMDDRTFAKAAWDAALARAQPVPVTASA